MTDQTPPLPNSNPPAGSTPPPPPPPPRPTAPAAQAPAPPSRSGPRKSLLVALVAVLAVAGIVMTLVMVMGGDDGSNGTVEAEGADAPVGTAAPEVTQPEVIQPEVTQPPETTDAPATTEAPTTTAAPSTTEAPTTTVAGPSFPTLPDGSPEPIVAIYDGPTIRVSGWVPSQEDADTLTALAIANSTDPNAVVEGELQIDPLVPVNIGTRVIEMNSPRFPAGSSQVTFEHAAQLDRVANVLTLLPNVTVTVVGHADQIGDEAANYALSEARAMSVVRYLVDKGIEPSRLAARAVGEQDLLLEDDSDASLALNRRTEFIFYGLIAD